MSRLSLIALAAWISIAQAPVPPKVSMPAALRPDPAVVCDACAEWNAPRQPFKVFGNTYFVGSMGLSSVLIAGDQGLILIDVALPQSAALIDANITALGFRTSDIKLILTSHAHFDHVGGVHSMQRFTRATVAASARTGRRAEARPPDSGRSAIWHRPRRQLSANHERPPRRERRRDPAPWEHRHHGTRHTRAHTGGHELDVAVVRGHTLSRDGLRRQPDRRLERGIQVHRRSHTPEPRRRVPQQPADGEQLAL